MLESYIVKPQTLDRIRASWIASEIERYVVWLAEQGYKTRSVLRRVPLALAFGEFARERGAQALEDLPAHVDAFVAAKVADYRGTRKGSAGVARYEVAKEVRGPIEQMLRVVVPGFAGSGRSHRALPFIDITPGFYEYLLRERGVRPETVRNYRHHLAAFEAYLGRIGAELKDVSPTILSAFLAERSAAGLGKMTLRDGCGVLRVFLRYAHREGVLGSDLSGSVEWPQIYRLSDIPRSITWAEVGKVLAGVERRTPAGKRDYAILLLLATYGLRAREVAALTLDDIDGSASDWRSPSARRATRRRFRSPARSARRSSTTCSTGGRRAPIGTCSSEPWLRCARSDPPRCPPARAITCSRPGSRSAVPALTPCATRACSGWSTPTSR